MVILQVEDDEKIFFAETCLSKAGIEDPVQVVQDGQEALEYLAGQGRYANRERFPVCWLRFV